ncbi:DedA family protein [Streptomyces sp. NPDC059255]|uniref:DedA family protein n=1 Tax=Streptomyces sp. NPDC059255 TaxID=3346793 RepID=UPI00367F080A
MTTLALGPSWLDPDYLIGTFGLIGVLVIVFAESGLLIGFFLPGDSLLFTTGLLVTAGTLKTPLWLVCGLIVLAAIAGDQVGYLFGRKVGPALFKRPDSKLFKQENVEKAHDFFEKYGPKSLVLARFVPVVRTFTPIIAGVSRMNYRSFITFNIIGGILWGAGVTLLGAALGKIDFVHENIEMILILIVVISVLPIVIEVLRARSHSKKSAGQAPAVDDGLVGPGTEAMEGYGAPVASGAPAPGAPGAETMRFPKISDASGPGGAPQAQAPAQAHAPAQEPGGYGQQPPGAYQPAGGYQAQGGYGQAPGLYQTPGGYQAPGAQQNPNPYQTPGGYQEQQGGYQGPGGYPNPQNPQAHQSPSPYQQGQQGQQGGQQGQQGGYPAPGPYQAAPGAYQDPGPYQAPHQHRGPGAPDDAPDGPGDPHGRHSRH